MQIPRPNRATVIGLCLLIGVVWWRNRRWVKRRLKTRILALERQCFPEWFPAPPKTSADMWKQSFKSGFKAVTPMQKMVDATSRAVGPKAKMGPLMASGALLDEWSVIVRCGKCGGTIRTETRPQPVFGVMDVSSHCSVCRSRWRDSFSYKDLQSSPKGPMGAAEVVLRRHFDRVQAGDPFAVALVPGPMSTWNGWTT